MFKGVEHNLPLTRRSICDAFPDVLLFTSFHALSDVSTAAPLTPSPDFTPWEQLTAAVYVLTEEGQPLDKCSRCGRQLRQESSGARPKPGHRPGLRLRTSHRFRSRPGSGSRSALSSCPLSGSVFWSTLSPSQFALKD